MTPFKSHCIQLFNTLTEFDPSEPVLVLYSRDVKCIEYRQIGKSVHIDWMSNYFIHKPFKVGVLYPKDLYVLKAKLKAIIEDQTIDKEFIVSIRENCTELYYTKYLNTEGFGPLLVTTLHYLTSKSKFIVWFAKIRSKKFKELLKTIRPVEK